MLLDKNLAFLLLLLFFACTNGKKDNIPYSNSERTEKQHKTKSELQPIFLNLSPKMDSEEFKSTLNRNSMITNRKFIIPINKKNIDFSINKTFDKIILEYENVRNISVDRLNRTISEGLISEQDETIKEFIEIFKLKYGNPIQEFNLNNLNRYNFDKQYYLAFQDSIKTILIGYENLGTIVLSNDELHEGFIAEGKKPKLEEVIKDSKGKKYSNELQRLADLAENTNTGAAEREYSNRLFNLEPKTFGIKLEINYLYNSDYDILLNAIEEYESSKEKTKQKRDSINALDKKTIERNKSNI